MKDGKTNTPLGMLIMIILITVTMLVGWSIGYRQATYECLSRRELDLQRTINAIDRAFEKHKEGKK